MSYAAALEHANPRGRVDVALYRAAERAAAKLCPDTWPQIKEAVAEAISRRVPRALGALPLIAIPIAAGAGAWAYKEAAPSVNWWTDVLLQTIGLKDAPAMPPAPSPGSQPPPAPQTKDKLLTWTPADAAEAMAQRGLQFTKDTAYWQAISKLPPIGNGIDGSKLDPSKPSEILWIAAALGALGLVLFLRGR